MMPRQSCWEGALLVFAAKSADLHLDRRDGSAYLVAWRAVRDLGEERVALLAHAHCATIVRA